MRNFEERKAEIFCRAQKQREKEKKARKRAWGIGVVTAFCLCITVVAVLHMPNLQEDMITDADSKGNAPVNGDTNQNVQSGEADDGDHGDYYSFPMIGLDPEDENSDPTEEYVSEEDLVEAPDESKGEGVAEETPEYDASADEETDASVQAPAEPLPEHSSEDVPVEENSDKLYEYMGAELALLYVNESYQDYLYDDLGKVLLAECDVLYLATDGGEKDRVKLVLPLFYAEQIEKGDALVALLADDDMYDMLLRDDTACILGKSDEVFEELERLTAFSSHMTVEEALEYFENFSE